MKGDFSRIRFNPAKQYTAVLEQQGRVALDSDANEQSAIDAHIRDVTNLDVIGRYGAPEGDAGFAISIDNDEIRIGHGRYYVEGLLVENNSVSSYDDQPSLINPTFTAAEILDAVQTGDGNVTAHLFLQVWQRLVTALDDPCLREPALGQADTTARLQTVWRVVGTLEDATTEKGGGTGVATGGAAGGGTLQLLDAARAHAITTTRPTSPIINRPRPGSGAGIISTGTGSVGTVSTGGSTGTVGTIIGNPKPSGPVAGLSPCCQSLYDDGLRQRSGAMMADTSGGNADCGCQPIAAAGYQGLENQLYRVEVHTPGSLDTATFKWSRENGSVVTAITAVNGPVVTVSTVGPDANLGFQAGQWVELSDDTYLFGDPPNQPGQLYQIQSAGPGPLQFTLTSPVAAIDPARNARMRRWDQSGAAATSKGIPLSTSPIQLENGIEVTFRKGTYVSGDYWTIPARAATGAIEWPPCGSDGNAWQSPQFALIYNAPLACIHLRPATNLRIKFANPFLVDDCRLKFPPLTALAAQQSEALHIASTSWVNDDVMTVDTLLENGLSLTLDQAPSCPWGGGNFQVTLEAPVATDTAFAEVFKRLSFGVNLDPTNAFLRSVTALDPPGGISVSGETVTWLAPAANTDVGLKVTFILWEILNLFLNNALTFGAFARVRVRLLGAAVFSASQSGNIYLDGVSFGDTASRSSNGSSSITLLDPSGTSQKSSDFNSWFYLAPTVAISAVVIQGIENGVPKALSAVTVEVNAQGQMIGLQLTGTPAPVAVTAVQAVILLNYAPIADTTITLSLFGPGVGSVVSIQPTATVPAGKRNVIVPIKIQASPGVNANGAGNTDTVTLNASVPTAIGNRSFDNPPSLAITGGPVPPPQIN
ncbi:hypothetical protein DYQ86_17060 [Acidobacteria bacterium AB60]|nr:hypothetical protein DYQ86_17060 [Acidobacteria bacterium AB60]